jgi:voltage-gated potassium channel
MANSDRILGFHLPHRAWWSAVGFSALIIFMVAVGSTDEFGILTVMILAAVFSAAGTFLWMFPGSRFFVLAFANSLAIYTIVYFFLVEANFRNVEEWASAVGYLVPIYTFLAGVWWHREAIRDASQAEGFNRMRFTGRVFLWLLPVGLIAGLTFLVPGVQLGTGGADILFLVLIGGLGVFVMVVSRQICLFLIDTGVMFDHLFIQMARLSRPAFAFFTLYSFSVIVFAMIYRIMDRITVDPIFLIEGNPELISFTESLYFSLITMSMVGYGDITPAGEGVRVLAAIQIMLGLVLVLFAFAEIMRYARNPDVEGKTDT